MKIDEAIVGRKVVYKPFEGCSNDQIEEGVITGTNDKFIFVRYGNDVNGKATNPNDIKYL